MVNDLMGCFLVGVGGGFVLFLFAGWSAFGWLCGAFLCMIFYFSVGRFVLRLFISILLLLLSSSDCSALVLIFLFLLLDASSLGFHIFHLLLFSLDTVCS